MKAQNAPLIIFTTLVFIWNGALLSYFPCGSVAVPWLLLALAAGIAFLCYKSVGYCSRTGLYILTAAWMMLATGYILNLNYFTVHDGGTLFAPVLHNFDASTSWIRMLEVLNGTAPGDLRMLGYGQLLALLTLGMPPRLDVLLAFNVLATMVTVILTGAVTAYLQTGTDEEKKRSSAWAMLLMVCVCYFMASGCILIKDAVMCLAMAGVLFSLARLKTFNKSYGSYIILIASTLLAALVRPLLLPFIMMAVIMMTAVSQRNRIMPAIILVLACAALFAYTRSTGTAAEVINIHGTTSMELETGAAQRLEAYRTVSPEYNSLSFGSKLIRLPFSLCVQFLTPLPWAFGRDVVFGPTQAYAHIAYPWYAVGGLALFFLFFMLRKAPRGIAVVFTFGVIATVITAFFTGGTISRYCLVWLSALVPGAALVIVSGRWRTKQFACWAVIFAILVAAALCVTFHFLNIYSPGGWEAV